MIIAELIRELIDERRKRRDEANAYTAWRRAIHAYHDTATIFGACDPLTDAAVTRERDTYQAYIELRNAREREQETR